MWYFQFYCDNSSSFCLCAFRILNILVQGCQTDPVKGHVAWSKSGVFLLGWNENLQPHGPLLDQFDTPVLVCFQTRNRSTGLLFVSLIYWLLVQPVSLSIVLMFGLHSPVVWLPLAASLVSQITYNCIACQWQTVLSTLLVAFCLSSRNISSPLPALALAAETNNNYHCVTPQRHRTGQLWMLGLYGQRGLQVEPGLCFSFYVCETDSRWKGYELQGCSWHAAIISTVCKWGKLFGFLKYSPQNCHEALKQGGEKNTSTSTVHNDFRQFEFISSAVCSKKEMLVKNL